ncbi:MAG: nicotinate phosphoribosyltransferase [Sclerophora amabilis]|nr:MAG: nicotinate phosphoribosyltransferase [Sclerophora amabilis]
MVSIDIEHSSGLPEGIFSLLDTDLYKLTMQCAVLLYFPLVEVTYSFTNRTPLMKFSRVAFRWLEVQIAKLANLSLSEDEFRWLKSMCPYLGPSYLEYLANFKFEPSRQLDVSFELENDTGDDDDIGEIHIGVRGLWVETILYEIPLLALTSEAYFRFRDRDWSHEGQEAKAYAKGKTLLQHGCMFSEFGTRRRRDYHTQDLVIRGLSRAAADGGEKGWRGKLVGTSNVHLAMKHGIAPIGTVAHEWFMGIAAITNNYMSASETALRYWVGCFGEGVLSVALTDTFGTPAFLESFRKSMPVLSSNTPGDAATPVEKRAKSRTYAQIFTGVRQDSGDPSDFIKVMRKFYNREGIKEKKTIVFSDSLDIERCLKYKQEAEEAGFLASFGIGTFFTNDFTHASSNERSAPLNIVIKLSSAAAHHAVKISDNIGKNTGDRDTVESVKETLGYVEKCWKGGDESVRLGAACNPDSQNANRFSG